MKQKVALVIGATGATGKELVEQLLVHSQYKEVHVFVRKPLSKNHPHLKQHVVDFDQPNAWKDLLQGDVLYSTLGTTLKAAGSKEKQYTIDYTYQYQTICNAKERGVHTLVLVSSAGANARSSIFYSRIKGQLEDAVKKLAFDHLYIFQPSLLDRGAMARKSERWALGILGCFAKLGLKIRYTPMPVSTLANKMIVVAENERAAGCYTFTLSEIFEL